MMAVPAMLFVAALGLLALAILAPRPAIERVRTLERAHGDRPLIVALDDPDPEVAAIAAVLLRARGRDDAIRSSSRAGELEERFGI